MSNSQFDEPPNIVVNDGKKNEEPINSANQLLTAKNISEIPENSITINQKATIGGKNISTITINNTTINNITINNSIGDKDSDATSGAIEYHPSDVDNDREKIWRLSNSVLQGWVNSNFLTAKEKYDSIYKSFFVTIFSN